MVGNQSRWCLAQGKVWTCGFGEARGKRGSRFPGAFDGVMATKQRPPGVQQVLHTIQLWEMARNRPGKSDE